jgi:hypothetical protein
MQITRNHNIIHLLPAFTLHSAAKIEAVSDAISYDAVCETVFALSQ